MTDESRPCTSWHARVVALRRSLPGALPVMVILLSAATPASAVPSANPGDRAITRSAVMEDGPAITVDPTRANAFAIAFVRGDSCFVRTSTTSGRTWTAPVQLRSSVADSSCVAADIAYAPDSNRIYVVYAEWGPESGYPQMNRILVSVSTNGGGAWDTPRVLLEGSSDPDGDAYLEPQIATPPIPSEARWAYVTAVQHSRSGAASVLLRSPDYGETWTETAWAGIRSTGWGETLPPLQATRHTLTAGPAGQVLLVSACGGCEDIAYPDGITRDQGIRLWRSSDHGASLTSSTPVYARRGALAYNFPANVAWGWGQTAFGPAVEFGTGAVAHIVYPANGHIHYIWAKPPYTTWSAPEQVDDSPIGTKQGPALQVLQAQVGQGADPVGPVVQAVDEVEAFAAGMDKGLLGLHGDLFQRLQVVGRKAGADGLDALDALLSQQLVHLDAVDLHVREQAPEAVGARGLVVGELHRLSQHLVRGELRGFVAVAVGLAVGRLGRVDEQHAHLLAVGELDGVSVDGPRDGRARRAARARRRRHAARAHQHHRQQRSSLHVRARRHRTAG